jgi:microcystin-dependent protein
MGCWNFAPVGWAFCNGQLLPISQYSTLFNLIGTTYGGNGITTFALPDLRGRVPVHQGKGYNLGQSAGTETVTLSLNQIPAHSHALNVLTGTGTQPSPKGGFWAESSLGQFSSAPPMANMAPALQPSGGGQPHINVSPYLAVNFIISLFGVYPSQN